MTDKSLGGVLTAIVTPFNRYGAIDWRRLEQNLQFQKQAGVNGIVVTDITGESPLLSWDKQIAIIQRVVHVLDDSLIILAATGSNATFEALDASIEAIREGVHGVLLVDPYYVRANSGQILEYYYLKIAKTLNEARPQSWVIPYLNPLRTGSLIAPADLINLAVQCDNIIGVKDATGSTENPRRIRQLTAKTLLGRDFAILSGDDRLACDTITDPAIKGSGVVSAISNLAPVAMVEMVNACLSGDVATSLELARALKPLFDIVTVTVDFQEDGQTRTETYPNPCGIKTALAGLGIDSGFLPPPLMVVKRSGLNFVTFVRDRLMQVATHNPEILEPLAEFYGINLAERLSDEKAWKALTAE